MNHRQKIQELKNKGLKLYMNYSVQEGKIFGVPYKGEELYKNTMEKVNIEQHKEFIQLHKDMVKQLDSMGLSNMDNVRKEKEKVERTEKRFNNALSKLNKQSA